MKVTDYAAIAMLGAISTAFVVLAIGIWRKLRDADAIHVWPGEYRRRWRLQGWALATLSLALGLATFAFGLYLVMHP